MPGRPKYKYKLKNWELKELETVVSSKFCGKEKRLRAYILLKCDSGRVGGCWPDDKITEAYSVSSSKIYNVRKRMVEGGLDFALHRKQRLRPPRPRKLDGEQEARLISIACSESPEGYSNWTMELLADKLVRLKVVDSISNECVRSTLKKMNLNLG